MRFLGCTCVTDQLRVPNAVITLARLSLTENGRSRSRKKTQFSVDDREKKGLISLFVHYFVHRGINSRFRHKDHRVSSVFFFTKKNLWEQKGERGNTRWKKGKKQKKTRAQNKRGSNRSEYLKMYFTECCLCLSRIWYGYKELQTCPVPWWRDARQTPCFHRFFRWMKNVEKNQELEEWKA